jgi:multiple sugar transport system permease protein
VGTTITYRASDQGSSIADDYTVLNPELAKFVQFMTSPAERAPMAPPRSFIWTHWLVLGALTIFAPMVPVFVMVSSSLKPLQDVTGTFRWIPVPVTFSPYIQMWQTVPLAHYFVNSLIVCTSAAALSVLLATFAAYAVSRYRFRGRRLFTLVVLSTQMSPGILFLLPLFLIFVSIGNATGIALYGSLTGWSSPT